MTFLMIICNLRCSFFFFFNDTATTEIYTLSLHDALPIYGAQHEQIKAAKVGQRLPQDEKYDRADDRPLQDRKSTRLNSSHSQISYAVFCLKKKKKTLHTLPQLPHSNLYNILLHRTFYHID